MTLSIYDNYNRYHISWLTATYNSGLIRPHILHHALEFPIFGLAMPAELQRYGYRIR